MKKTLAAMVALALMLSGCDSIRTGKVTEKRYTAPYTDTWSSKYPAMHPEQYRICLKDARGNEGCMDVPKDEYKKYKVGDQYP